MARNKVKTHVILLTTIHRQSSRHDTTVSLLPANVDRPAESSPIRVVRLNDMCLVDLDFSVNVGRIDPIAGEVLREATTRLHNLTLHRCYAVPLRRLFHRLERVTLGRDRPTNVQIIVTILQETPILFILTRLLGVHNGKIVILTNEPVAQAAVLDHAVERAIHSLALPISYVKLLVLDQKLRPGRLAGLDTRVWTVALTGEAEAILVCKVPHSFQRRTTAHRVKILVKQRDQLLVLAQRSTNSFNRWLLIPFQRNAGRLKLLENVQRPGERLHAGVAIGTLQNEGMIRANLLAVDTLGPHAPLRRTLPLVGPRIDGRGRGLTKLPAEPGALQDLRNNTLPGGRRKPQRGQ
uniref:(northern house mosquito) hypothetical protein n=1 Tax=Culex pipiens TaxID=7175 RepID=A0A8D8MCU4_CULPI